jgi:CheY-like chemotaxis protein
MAAIPIIAVSAQSEGVAQRMALAFGCSGFIAKPIDTRAFPAQVANYLKRSQS